MISAERLRELNVSHPLKRVAQKLAEFSVPDAATGCINWSGAKHTGYGRLYAGMFPVAAHRMAWVCFVGDIPKELYVDHICRNRACLNVKHLRLATPRQNSVENSVSPPAINLAKTHCRNGHALVEGNLDKYKITTGARVCLICRRKEHLRFRIKRRARLETALARIVQLEAEVAILRRLGGQTT